MSNRSFKGKAIIFSAPSGAGKTTIVKSLLEKELPLLFSISACSRNRRPNEINGKDYHFLSLDDFKSKIASNAFVEWEEVYENNYYGTLKSEIERIWNSHQHVVFDVDVVGGLNLKRHFGDNALAIFIEPPSLDILFKRLENRATESKKSLNARIEKATYEMTFSSSFDLIVVNDNLEKAKNDAFEKVKKFLKS
ncbi:MAG: guanylate kinase [Bacteroidota bacterium]|nr:guanylate kinase [Bacteroidota bacterium]